MGRRAHLADKMDTVYSLWFIFALVTQSTANNDCQEMCVLEDVSCVTDGANNFFRPIAKRYDPVFIKRIDGQQDKSRYNLYDVKLSGMADCNVTRLELTVPNQDYRHYVHCLKLVLSLKYQIGENSQKYPLTVTARHYRVLNNGQYGISVSCKDHQPHFFLQSVETQVALRGGDNRTSRIKLAERFMYLVTKHVTLIVFRGINEYFDTHSMSEAFPMLRHNTSDNQDEFCKHLYRNL